MNNEIQPSGFCKIDRSDESKHHSCLSYVLSLKKYLKNKVHLEMLLQISKELINNIFKHSNATYIKYEIKLDENMVLIINCKSDGASAIDYENIFKSKGGVLLLRVLVEANNGKLTYNYSNGILWSSVELEVD